MVMQDEAVQPCRPADAERHTGYKVGGTSPFGTRKLLPVYAERSIFDLVRIYINGGRRGYLVCIAPVVLTRIVDATPVDAATTNQQTAT